MIITVYCIKGLYYRKINEKVEQITYDEYAEYFK